ncbi:hypothetical protein [Nocardioides plantarum]|uniref:hypothetical protein n=1 Tax=Nocardioides plantarum TaxID=29299 RepID=UPI003609F17E
MISQGSSVGFRPGVFVFDDDVHWARMLKAVLGHLTSSGRTGPPAHVRIKSGDILRDSGFASALSYGPFVENEGRTLLSWQDRRRAALDRDHEVRLREILDVHNPSPKQPLVGSPALVFSHIDDDDLTATRGLGEVGSNLIAHGRFDPRDPVVASLLWGQMLPTVVVSHGRVLERLEDEPELEESGGTLLLTNPTRSFVGEAIFYEAFDETVYTDERALGWDMPDPLPIPAPPPQHDTPVGQVLRRIEDRTGPRISSQDRREDGADVSRTLAFHQYPNPNEVERKVRTYLLDPGHEKQRWVEFADHGLLDRGTTALLVASSLSSVLLSPFPAADIRPTADAALQFTVPVALPTRRGHLLLTTSWTFRDRTNPLATADLGDGDPRDPGPASGLWLATAHPNPREDEYGSPFATAFH